MQGVSFGLFSIKQLPSSQTCMVQSFVVGPQSDSELQPGDAAGETVGILEGSPLGASVGRSDGMLDGTSVGVVVGILEGISLG